MKSVDRLRLFILVSYTLVITLLLAAIFSSVVANADNLPELKNVSCLLMEETLVTHWQRYHDKSKILPYVRQYMNQCIKPVESDFVLTKNLRIARK